LILVLVMDNCLLLSVLVIFWKSLF